MRNVFLCVAFCYICASPVFSYDWVTNPGDGSPQNPYRISTAEQLNSIGNDANLLPKCFSLDNDIDLQAYAPDKFNIIGGSPNGGWLFEFTGAFDGNGHVIRNFTWSGSRGFVGVFGYLGNGGMIKNLVVADVNIDAGDGCYIAGLAGRNEGTIKDCFVTGTVRGNQTCGGITGYVAGHSSIAAISNCTFEGTVVGQWGVGGIAGSSDICKIERCKATCNIIGGIACGYGGIVGMNQGGDLSQCFAEGTILATGWGVGGIAGISGDHCGIGGNITQCYAIVNVSGSDSVGGFVGDLRGMNFLVANCYAQGTASSHGYVGGFGGQIVMNSYNYPNTGLSRCYCAVEVNGSNSAKTGGFAGNLAYSVFSCFWDAEISGQTIGVGGGSLVGVFSKATAEMKTKSTFTAASWDFVNIWSIRDGMGYPRFVWENHSPIANAGADETFYAWIDGKAKVGLDGSGSNDADGDALSYKWTWVIGADSFEANGVNPTIELPAGVHRITLIVNDGLADSAPDEVEIRVVGPVDAIMGIREDVIAMNLAKGTANELFAKLDTAMKKFEDGNNVAAVNSLKAFINAVSAQRGKKIPQQDADYLVEAAQTIIGLLDR